MNNFITKSFSLSFKLLHFVGMYPKTDNSYLYTISAFLAYSLFALLIPVLAIVHIVVEETDMAIINYNAMFLSQSVAFTVKIFPFIIHHNKIKKCLNYFETSNFFTTSSEDQIILDKCVATCRRNVVIFFSIIIGGICGWLCKPLLGKTYKIPLDVWLPCLNTAEYTKITVWYCLLYFITSIGKHNHFIINDINCYQKHIFNYFVVT